MPEFLEDRRSSTRSRICRLRSQLTAAEDRCGVKACVYITGSVGRHEAGPQSDLDLFIADLGNPEKCLSAQDEILIAADLIKESRSARFPELALGGEHRLTHTMGELVGNLGTDRDDATNTLTARCLLLLESKLLLGGKAYSKLVDGVLGRYWRDYADHRDDFVPAFLTNDILRMWRTFCVNYEAKRQTERPEYKAKARLKHFKLGHSRLLTCYSALLFLMQIYGQKGSVSPDDARAMVGFTPTERLESVCTTSADVELRQRIAELLAGYKSFLDTTSAPAEELLQRFGGNEAKKMAAQAHKFGEKVFACIEQLGHSSEHKELFRFLIV